MTDPQENSMDDRQDMVGTAGLQSGAQVGSGYGNGQDAGTAQQPEEDATVPMKKQESDISTQPLERISEPVEEIDTATQPLVRSGDGSQDGIMQTEGDEFRPLKISCHACGQKLDLTTLDPFSHIECPACGAEIIVPAWFDNYLLEEAGGTGGMATVYRALDLALDREVAIKILHPALSAQMDKSELFLREARTAATINHYAVIPIYTCGIHNRQTYIVMQYMSGGSLENILRNAVDPLPLLNVLSWISDVAAGLENARQHGIVHHDIKPANIMLDSDGKAKIGDFGIAQVVSGTNGAGQSAEPNAYSWLSPYYTSPEKIRTGTEDYRGDIYSLGATFYHLVTGFPPFQHSDLDELVRMRLTNDPMPPHLQRKDIPIHLSELILNMMSREPGERPDYIDIQEILNEYISQPELLSVQYIKLANNENRSSRPAEQQNGPQKASSSKILIEPQTSSPFVLKLIIHFLILLIILIISFFTLNKYNKLNAFVRYMPDFIQAEKKILRPEPRLNAQFVEDFQTGRPDDILNSTEESLKISKPEKRFQAALQTAYAAYLGTPSVPPAEFVSAIAEDIRKNASDYEQIAFEDHILLIRYLAGKISESEVEYSRFPHAEDFKAKKALAVFLKKLYSDPKMPKEGLEEYLSFFESALNRLDSRSWISLAFTKRLFIWKLAIQHEIAGPDSLEKIFYPRLKEIPPDEDRAARRGMMVQNEISIPVQDAPGHSKTLSMNALSETAAKIGGIIYVRPKPEFPMTFLKIEPALKYREKIADLDDTGAERFRLSQLLKIKPFLISVTSRFPLKVDRFSAGGTSYGEGTVVFHSDRIAYLSGRHAYMGDSTSADIEIPWEQCSAVQLGEFLIRSAWRLTAYALRANQVGDNFREKPDDPAEIRAKKQKSADAWLLAAYYASWYGRHKETLECLQRAVSISETPSEVIESISKYFLGY